MFAEYDQDHHDQFLRNRYYKMRSEFSTAEHFNHPNSEQGPSSAPRRPKPQYTVNYSSDYLQFLRQRAEKEDTFINRRRTLIILFAVFSNVVLYYWLQDRRRRGREVQMQSYD